MKKIAKPTIDLNIKRIADEAWLGLGDTSRYEIINRLLYRTQEDRERPDLHTLRFLRDPRNFWTTCKLLFDIELHPIQVYILQELWIRPFPMYIASRGFGKSFLLALYCVLKLLLVPGTKIVIVGAAFRQSKIIFEYMDTIWRGSPILRDIAGNPQESGPRRDIDRCTFRINDSIAIAVPLGDGNKIRGLRAHIIIADEFSSIPPDIYETVVVGFGAVSAKPIDNVKEEAKRLYLQDEGLWTPEAEETYSERTGNQAIISGTAGYDFQHFANYWKKYKAIIQSRGDIRKLEEHFGEEAHKHANWKDYSIIRVPYELIPKGFMDDKQVSRAKATIHSGIYQMEYGAVFTADSEGFFRRSLIESCVTSKTKPILLPSGEIYFSATIKGDSKCRYVYGVDPASEKDNFSIVILELHGDHTRIVYGWSTNRDDFKKRQAAGLVKENDYYGFCVRKLRSLMKVFPCERIGMDGQGGGVAIREAFHDPDKIYEGEQLVWEVIEEDNEKDTDDKPGLHILEIVQFVRAEWTAEANHGLRKDMEDKVLLFPEFNAVELALAVEQDASAIRDGDKNKHYDSETGSVYDSLEDCVMEIEQLKDELATIIMTQTGITGRDRWDTPEVKGQHGKKGRLRKDRYSALVIANMLARQIHRTEVRKDYVAVGGFASQVPKSDGQLYVGPEWFTKGNFLNKKRR